MIKLNMLHFKTFYDWFLIHLDKIRSVVCENLNIIIGFSQNQLILPILQNAIEQCRSMQNEKRPPRTPRNLAATHSPQESYTGKQCSRLLQKMYKSTPVSGLKSFFFLLWMIWKPTGVSYTLSPHRQKKSEAARISVGVGVCLDLFLNISLWPKTLFWE